MNLGEWIVVGIMVTVIVAAVFSWGGKHPKTAAEIDDLEAKAKAALEAESKKL